jgi:zinc protease
VVLNPTFPDADFQRRQAQRLADIRCEKSAPGGIAMRVLPRLLYGEGHAYGAPFSGVGTEAGVTGLTAEDMRRFHDRWFLPNNATLTVTGDISLSEVTPKLERLFGRWKAGAVPRKTIAVVPPRKTPAVFLVDRPVRFSP